ncbi:MAG: T9SS type A sorting domain-containing protein [Chitinophagaceae bacterium]
MRIFLPLFIIILSNIVCPVPAFSQSPAFTANDSVRPYAAQFGYGSNMGYFGNGWDDKGLAALVNKAGGRTIRPSLPESFLERYGYTFNLNNFQTYVNELGMKEITCFIGGPAEIHRDSTVYPGSEKQSKLFANLYEPIWNADSSVNQNNYYAGYVYKLILNYGDYIRFWEVVNEPDYAYSYSIAQKWATRAPLPGELPNMLAPVYNYIRMLRITWEVVKRYSPEDYVTTGGIGYTQFLGALLKYTDNPDQGAVTAQYPNKGGAYFDVLSYHVYPAFNMAKWDNAIGGFRYTRTSDYVAKNVIDFKEEMDAVLQGYGYNGSTYPKKNFLLTETNISRRTAGDHVSSDEMQRNFGIKSLILAQKNNIAQYYIFDLGEAADAPPSTDSVIGYDEFRLMGLYENLKRDLPGAEKATDLGIAFKSTAQLLYGYRYDSLQTAALQMTGNMEGAAFKKGNKFAYVLWVKALTDKSEIASANYSFPSGFQRNTVYRYEWNFSVTDSVSLLSSQNLSLTGSPSIFSDEIISKLPTNQIINFPAISSRTYGTSPFVLSATASSGLQVSFKVISGNATISGDTLTLTGAGTVIVAASQGGNNNYAEAVKVLQSFVLNKNGQTIDFPAVPSKTFSDTSFDLPASASSGLEVTFRVLSGNAVVIANKVKLTGSGWVIVEASQAGDSSYSAAKPVTQGFTAYKASQTIDFAALPSKTYGDIPFAVNATSSSGLPASFRIVYGPATISGNVITLTSNGLVGVEASQAGSSAYSLAPNITQSFQVNRIAANASSLFSKSHYFEGTSDTHLSPFPPNSGSSNGVTPNVLSGDNLIVFPNPFLNQIQVRFTTKETGNVNIRLFDMHGNLIRLVYTGRVQAASQQKLVMQSVGLINSTYILQFSTTSGVVSKQIILSRP